MKYVKTSLLCLNEVTQRLKNKNKSIIKIITPNSSILEADCETVLECKEKNICVIFYKD